MKGARCLLRRRDVAHAKQFCEFHRGIELTHVNLITRLGSALLERKIRQGCSGMGPHEQLLRIKLKESSSLLDESYAIDVPLSSIGSVCIFIIRTHTAYGL